MEAIFRVNSPICFKLRTITCQLVAHLGLQIVFGKQLGCPKSGEQRTVDLMGHGSGQLNDCLQFAALVLLFSQQVLAGDVTDNLDNVCDVAAGIVNRRGGALEPASAIIRSKFLDKRSHLLALKDLIDRTDTFRGPASSP